jgi:hypothetical protein
MAKPYQSLHLEGEAGEIRMLLAMAQFTQTTAVPIGEKKRHVIEIFSTRPPGAICRRCRRGSPAVLAGRLAESTSSRSACRRVRQQRRPRRAQERPGQDKEGLLEDVSG